MIAAQTTNKLNKTYSLPIVQKYLECSKNVTIATTYSGSDVKNPNMYLEIQEKLHIKTCAFQQLRTIKYSNIS